MVLIVGAREGAVHEHIALVIEEVLAVVTHVNQHYGTPRLLQLAEDAVDEIVGKVDGVVVGVDEYGFHVAERGEVLGAQVVPRHPAIVVDVHIGEHIAQAHAFHVGREDLEIIGITFRVLEVAAERMEHNHLALVVLRQHVAQGGKQDCVHKDLRLGGRYVAGVVALRGDVLQEVVVETLVGYPRRLVARFLKSGDYGFLFGVHIGRLRRGTREHERHRDRGEVGNGVATVEGDDLFATGCQAGRGLTLVTVDGPVVVARCLADKEDHHSGVAIGQTRYAESEVLQGFVLLVDVPQHVGEVVARQSHIDGADLLRTHPCGGAEVEVADTEDVAHLGAQFEGDNVGGKECRYHAQRHHTPLARSEVLALYKAVIQKEIHAPQREEDEGDEPVGTTQLLDFARLGFDDREDEQQRGSGVIHNEMHHLYAREDKRQRCHVEEGAAAEEAQPRAVHCQRGDKVDAALPKREQILRHHHAHQEWEQEEERQADESDYL